MNQKKLSRPTHAGLRHVALNVKDLALVEKFYVELLGFKVEWRPDLDNVYLCSGNDNLALHTSSDVGGKSQVLGHLGIIIDKIEGVSQWHDFLSENNVKIATEPKTHRDGARSFYCYDPEGVVVQIIFHPPISKGELNKSEVT